MEIFLLILIRVTRTFSNFLFLFIYFFSKKKIRWNWLENYCYWCQWSTCSRTQWYRRCWKKTSRFLKSYWRMVQNLQNPRWKTRKQICFQWRSQKQSLCLKSYSWSSHRLEKTYHKKHSKQNRNIWDRCK